MATMRAGGLRITRAWAEAAAGLATGALGVAIVVGALEYGIGWSEGGPQAGTFPFSVGLIVIAASLGNVVQARRHRGSVFADAVQLRRVAAFVVPMVLFVVAALALGLYVAAALYVGGVMRVQGGYRWRVALPVALGTALFFHVVLEVWFKVPLLKGPLEPLLGLH
jgi:hypothetical protein